MSICFGGNERIKRFPSVTIFKMYSITFTFSPFTLFWRYIVEGIPKCNGYVLCCSLAVYLLLCLPALLRGRDCHMAGAMIPQHYLSVVVSGSISYSRENILIHV